MSCKILRFPLDTATLDYDASQDKDRHMFRLASMAEVPIPVEK